MTLPKGSAINNDTVAFEAGQNVPFPAQQVEQAENRKKAVKTDSEQLK